MQHVRILTLLTLIGALLLGTAGAVAQTSADPTPPGERVLPDEIPTRIGATPDAGIGYEPVAELVLPPGDDDTVRAVEANGDYAYLLTREGALHTYDVSAVPTTPPSPGEVVTLDDPLDSLAVAYGYGLLRNGPLLYLWDGFGGAIVVDTSDGASPALGDPFDDRSLINMTLVGNTLVGVGSGHVTVYTLDDPAVPQIATSLNLGPDNRGFSVAVLDGVLVVGQLATGPQGTSGLVVFDFPSPDTLNLIGTFPTAAPYHLLPFEDTLVACNTNMVELWDLTSPDDPTLEDTFQTFARVCARDTDVVVTNGHVLRPENNQLSFVASFDPGAGQADGFPYGSDVEAPFIFLAQSPRVLLLNRPQPLVSPFAGVPPRIDGRLSLGEWTFGDTIDLEHGFVAVRNSATHLYVLLDMTGDYLSDLDDDLTISFDVDRDGAVTPLVDINYHLQSQTDNLRYRFYDFGQGYRPDQPDYRSSRAGSYGCALADGSLYIHPQEGVICERHVIWELAIDLSEIGAQPGDSIRMGVGVSSGSPEFFDAVPANFEFDFSNLFEIELGEPIITLPPADDRPAMPFAADPFEVTQAIQTTDNSLPLVADKDTAARVYLDNNDGSPTLVTVYLYGRRDGVDLPGSPLVAFLDAPTAVNRDNLDDTANFSLPDSWLTTGSVQFQARVKRWLGAETATSNTTLDFQTREVPVVWTIPVNQGSTGSPVLLPADDIADSKAYMETVYPVPDITFVDKPWTALGANAPHGDTLLDELNNYHGTAVLAWILGFLFTGESPFDLPDQVLGFTPTTDGKADPTWFNNGNGYVAYAGDITNGNLIMAHEINHNLDRSTNGTWGRHNGGCGAPGVDPNWPYPNDDINEIGFDTRAPWVDGVVSDRRTVITDGYPDFMSYCQHPNMPGEWISPYRWNNLFDVFAPPARSVGSLATQRALAMADAIEEVMVLSGRLGVGGDGELHPIFVQQGYPTPDPSGTQYSIEIRDGDGLLLDSLTFDIVFEDVEGEPVEDVFFNFQVPNPVGVASVQLFDGDTLLDEILVSPNPPEVAILEPNGGEVWQDTGTILWEAGDPDDDALTFSLLYSPDDGATWHPIAGDISGSEFEVDADLLPGGTGGRVRIIASDGYNTVAADSAGTFEVANRAPNVTILEPDEGARFAGGAFVNLEGVAQDAEDGPLPEETYLWFIDGELAAVGSQAEIILSDGFHTVDLSVTDGDDNTTTVSRRIVVGDAGQVYLPFLTK